MVKKTSKKTSRASTAPDFEKAISELEALVEKMEKGDQSLEQSLKDFERGVELTRACQQALKQAEQKVQTLLDKSAQSDLAPFDEE